MKKVLGPAFAALFGGALLTYGVSQEIPVGRLTGKVTMKENGRPLPNALVTLTLIGQPDDERPQVKGVETAADGTYSFPSLAAGDYELDVSAREHNIESIRVTVREGKPGRRDVKAEPNEPYLNLYASQKVFLPAETPRVELHGFLPEGEVRLRVVRLDDEEIAKKGSYSAAIGPLARSDDATPFADMGKTVVDVKEAIDKRDAEGAFVQTLPVGALQEGVYFVDCRSGEKKANTVLLVSKLALVSKTGADGTLLYTTDLATGKPVPGAEIFARTKDNLERIGQTGPDGTLKTQLVTVDNRQTVMARFGASVAIVDSYRNDSEKEDVWIGAYTERPAYRPGDTVFFKGFVRQKEGDGYRLPDPVEVAVEINDPDGNKLRELSLPLSAHGSFSGSFTTSKEGKPGGYNIECSALGGESQGVYANVVAYRKPEFSIEVSPKKDHYTMGDRAAAIVECKYYYGGPVVGAKVKTTIYRTPSYTYANEDGEEQMGESYGGGEYSEEVEATTDAAGRATIEFDTRGENDPEILTNDYQYTVSASVTEDGGKYFDGEGQVRVTRGDFGMSLEVLNPILVVGDTAEILVTTTDPTDVKKPIGNRDVTIESGIETYTKGTTVFVPREHFTVTTDANGKATLRLPIKEVDSLTFRAKAQDDSRRTIVADAWAYVEGSPARADAAMGDIKLTLNQKNYKQGDQAKALLQTDTPGGTALVCVQSDRILWRKLVPLTSGSTLVEVPVIKEYAPNVYVSVAYVCQKRFLQAERRLRVDREDRKLKVEVKPLKDIYKPGETAEVTVKTTDADGKPVAAEVSVGTVDRGIYYVASDGTDLYSSLYPERSNEVQTNYSFPEIYLDGGDKGSSKTPLRTEFKDTAGWTPAVWTGPGGEATVSIELPDNLTEWRVTAIGMSDASQTGMTTASFKARKPLMVRLGLPQFLVEGDHQRLTAVVTNDTGKDADVSLAFEVSGLKLDDVPKTLHVPADAPQTVELNVDALGAGQATLTARAEIAGGESDGVRQSFPILAHGRPILETRAGEGSVDFDLPLPDNLSPSLGDLKITVSPTLAGDLTKALDGLIDFPYGCTEQTMSRFLPAVLVEKTVRDLGLPKPKNLVRLPRIVDDSLARLAKMRHSEGGWGWWEYDASDPFMTALVLDGLDRAKRAGYDVGTANPESGVKWGMEFLKDPKRMKEASVRDRLYLIYALLRWGQADAASYLDGVNLRNRTEKVYGKLVERPTSAELATAALAYHEAGRDAGTLLNRLIKKARVGEETVDWAAEEGAWGEEATAISLVALQTIRPDDKLLPRIVRGLMATRMGDGWYSTRDTSYALVGLTAYLNHTKELSTPSSAEIFVNGRGYGPFALDPRAEDPAQTIRLPRAELGSKPVHIRVRATGKVYRTVALSGFEISKDLKAAATDKGLTVERKTFLMEARRASNGEMRLLPSEKPITDFKNGDVVRVELTIRSDLPREFVMVKEPTPSSCRVTERTELGEYEEKGWWWSRTIVMDDHLAFFARNLPKGESKIVYHMRAEAAGRATALPAHAANMYDPGRWASTAETRVQVTK